MICNIHLTKLAQLRYRERYAFCISLQEETKASARTRSLFAGKGIAHISNLFNRSSINSAISYASGLDPSSFSSALELLIERTPCLPDSGPIAADLSVDMFLSPFLAGRWSVGHFYFVHCESSPSGILRILFKTLKGFLLIDWPTVSPTVIGSGCSPPIRDMRACVADLAVDTKGRTNSNRQRCLRVHSTAVSLLMCVSSNVSCLPSCWYVKTKLM